MEITVPIIVAMNDSTDFITRPFLLKISVLCFTAALWNRAGHYIFILWFLLSVFFLLLSFSSPILRRRILDVYHTSAHGVALECRSET